MTSGQGNGQHDHESNRRLGRGSEPVGDPSAGNDPHAHNDPHGHSVPGDAAHASSAPAPDANSPEAPVAPQVLAERAERFVLNACLDEILGDVAPPDLAPQILQRLAAARQSGEFQANGIHENGAAHVNGAAALAVNGQHVDPSAQNHNTHHANGHAANGVHSSAAQRAARGKSANEQRRDGAENGSPGRHRNAPAADSANSTAAPLASTKRGWLLVIAACAACLALGYVTYLNWQSVFGDPADPQNTIARDADATPQNGGPQNQLAGNGANARNNSARNGAGQNVGSSQNGMNGGGTNSGTNLDDNNSRIARTPGGNGADGNDPDSNDPDRSVPRFPSNAGTDGGSTLPPRIARPDADVVAQIDTEISRRWAEEQITPASLATDAEWCRRLYLDLLGRIPTVEESVDFVTASGADKRQQLVSRILYGSDYRDEFADHWASVWTNTLIGREGGTDATSLVSREGLHEYLTQAVSTNEPYDQLVTELVTATGANRPGTPDFNGAVNFLLDNMDNNATSATAKTAQIFLARQVQCAQCHNHPFNDEPQQRFWELNSFFRQARVVKGPNAPRRGQIARLVDRDFAGEGNNVRGPRGGDQQVGSAEAEIYFERANGLLEMAFPKFLDGTRANPSGRLADVNRRQELARMIVNSPWMSEAIVNRMWSHFLGFGFSRPVDDLGPHQSISHPELLRDLAQDFRSSGHDLRKLMQWIVLSQPYALSSEVTPSPTAGTAREQLAKDQPASEAPLFSRFYSRQLPPEAVYDSLLVAAGRHGRQSSQSRNMAEENQSRRLWLGQFTLELENDENREVDLFDGAIPQALEMWNGELTSQALSLKDQGLLASIVGSNLSANDKVKHLFLAALSREPSAAEMRVVRTMLREAGDSGTPQVLQDIYWSLLNSSEFILQH